jgi:hypothetical protein
LLGCALLLRLLRLLLLLLLGTIVLRAVRDARRLHGGADEL